MDWTQVGVILAALGLVMAWMHRRFDKLDDNISNAHKRIDATIIAGNQRADAINARIDITQSIIMRMLQDQGK